MVPGVAECVFVVNLGLEDVETLQTIFCLVLDGSNRGFSEFQDEFCNIFSNGIFSKNALFLF